ncbi:hypothetical protein TSC_c20470 [Thermus scotoductus SA-01]|uniref:Uncharacterized protein n=1 Tax=Thermus scotoductus (strain ATCC 700910 / SA-01) TaxID=743525 RepID=E8PNB8_THESS|nr:hypothetical protein TSC_c20470 [Thermus scotoductus SA-01]
MGGNTAFHTHRPYQATPTPPGFARGLYLREALACQGLWFSHLFPLGWGCAVASGPFLDCPYLLPEPGLA